MVEVPGLVLAPRWGTPGTCETPPESLPGVSQMTHVPHPAPRLLASYVDLLLGRALRAVPDEVAVDEDGNFEVVVPDEALCLVLEEAA